MDEGQMSPGRAADTGAGDRGRAAGPLDLADRTFVSTEVVGHDLVPGTRVHVFFGEDRITVRAGCNTLLGGATWDGGVLAVAQPMGRTMMACADDLMRQDDWLDAFLTSQPALRLAGTTLTVGDSTEGIVLDEQSR
jgi:heat shock protein HslJ